MVAKRWRLVALVVIALALPAGVLSASQAPVYKATAELVLGQQRLDGDFNAEATDLTDRQMATQMRVLTGNGVTELAEARGAVGTVGVSTPSLSNVLIVEASDHDAARAARTADAYAEAYIDFRTRQVQRTLDDAAEQLRQRIALLQQELDPLAEQVRLTPPDQRAAVQAAVHALQSGLQEQQASLQAQLGQLQVQRALAASGATLVRKAEVPAEPVSPQPTRDTALAIVLGLVLGVSSAVLLETLRLRHGDGTASDADAASMEADAPRRVVRGGDTSVAKPALASVPLERRPAAPASDAPTAVQVPTSASVGTAAGQSPRHLAPRPVKVPSR